MAKKKTQVKKKVGVAKPEALARYLGKRITLFCMNYFYTGQLAEVTKDAVRLLSPSIVYETGSFEDSGWKDAQALPQELWVMRSAVESFGVMK